jgi:RNA polymerase sigma factor (TIGR02999 family)
MVSEAFLRMPRAGEIEWQGSRHFYAIAARAMRRALVDYARQRGAAKNPAGHNRVELDSGKLPADDEGLDNALLVHEMLDEFSDELPVQARVVEMHFFAGMTFGDIGEIIGKDERTVKRYWKFARLWLLERINPSS